MEPERARGTLDGRETPGDIAVAMAAGIETDRPRVRMNACPEEKSEERKRVRVRK
jgi:hypothetical protein